MSSAPDLAKSARLILSEALSALQSFDNVPDALLEVAEPIAHAMGILHAIERGGGAVLDGRDKALSNVRSALDALQAVDVNHPAVDKATEAVASSLTKLFALARCAAVPAAAASAPARASSQPTGTPSVATSGGGRSSTLGTGKRPALDVTALAGTPARPSGAVAAPAAAAASAPPAATVALPATGAGPSGTLLVEAAPRAPSPGPAAVASTPPVVAPTSPAASPSPPGLDVGGPSPQAAAALGAPAAAAVAQEVEAARRALAEAEARAAEEARRLADARRVAEEKAAEAARLVAEAERRAAEQSALEAKVMQAVPGQEQAPRPIAGSSGVNVELGVHSPSNFYKGLAGNDVVDHGGVFVATYKIPKVGTPVALRVLLPGDLEFEADAIVQWTREVRSGDQHPGFGARFSRISVEGRQLVGRYARKREPMFYDDL